MALRNSFILIFLSINLCVYTTEAQTNPVSSDSSQQQVVQTKSPDSPLSDLKIYSGVFGGVAFPIGWLAKNVKTGYTAGLQFYTNGSVGLLLNLSYSSNPFIPSKGQGNINEFFVLFGLKLRIKEKENINIFLGFPCIGGLYSMNPSPDTFLPSKKYGGVASGAILYVGVNKLLMTQLRVVGGMLKGYSAHGYDMLGNYYSEPDMYIVHALIDLTVGIVF
jgi:hypothetical protein